MRGFCTAAVLAADPDAPRPWIASEYVEGPTLRTAVEQEGRAAAPTWSGWRCTPRPRWPRSTPPAWCTATSSRTTSSSARTGRG
ncbi:hypothetical protein ACFQXA_07015 [Nocardiopsis composta]